MLIETIIIVTIIILLLLLFLLLVIKRKSFAEKMCVFMLKFQLLLGNDDAKIKQYALKLVNKFPQNYFGHKALGQLYEKEGNINIALDEYIRAVELNEKNYDMHYKVAELLQKTEKNEEAIIMLQDLLKIKPDYLQATLLLGNILYDEERFKEAVSVYMLAIKYHPIEYELYYNLGMVYTRLNDFQRANEFYKRAAKLNSYLYNGQYNLALIAMIQGELDEAEMHLLKALDLEELEPTVYFYLSQISLLKGENEKALNYINLALELDKNIEKKIVEQPLFLPIQDRIRIPDEPSKKIVITLSEREIKTNNYLEEMYNLVDSLNGGKFTKIDSQKEIEQEQLENEKER